MALTTINPGDEITSQALNNNFNYLDGRIDTVGNSVQAVSSSVSSVNASLSSTINSNYNTLDTKITNTWNTASTNLTAHTSRTNNPHSVTKAQVGLGNCDNTSDLNKPVSTATQTAISNLNSSIQGTITDLSSSFSSQLDSVNSSAVKLTGNQTIAGNKTFSGSSTFSGSATFSGATTMSGNVTISGSSFNFAKCTTKPTTSSTASASKVNVVVKNYLNGYSGYRKWSDGLIEQWGRVAQSTDNITISLLQNYSDAKYTILLTPAYNQTPSTGVYACTAYNPSTNIKTYEFKVNFGNGSSGSYTYWYTCGY